MTVHQEIFDVGELLASLRIAVVTEDDFINKHIETLKRFIDSAQSYDAFSCYRTIRYDTPFDSSRRIKLTDTTIEITFDCHNGDVIDNFECNAPYRMFVGMNGSVEVPLLKHSVPIYNTYFRTRFVIDTTCGVPFNEIVFKYRSIAMLTNELRRKIVIGPHLNGGVLFDRMDVIVTRCK